MSHDLIKFCDAGNVDMVKLLLDNGADVESFDNRAIRWASQSGRYEVVKLLIKYGANIHSSNNSALKDASYYGHYEVVKLLLDNGDDAHFYYKTELRLAKKSSHDDVVELLESHIKLKSNSKSYTNFILRAITRSYRKIFR
ncbi:ankyrin repeat domain-containing protein [Candidatus Pacearchaeota archaeon]|nr:ankyrin repeat domain-containing protein [Candidatus Pacearchaeota archaeon]